MARILIIEDDELTAVALRNVMTDFGHEPLDPVSYGEQVLERVRESKPDLMIVDIRLKGTVDGIDAVLEVKKEFSIPFVYLTASTDDDHYQRAMQTNPAGYLVKPFVESEWKAVIDNALGLHA